MRWRAAGACLAVLVLAPPVAAQEPAADEGANVRKSEERERLDYGLPDYQRSLAALGAREQAEMATALAADPERTPAGLCGLVRQNGCLGDVHLWDWQERGHGLVEPVLFTSRSGANLSGHVWATRDGPARRPAVVFVTGSIQVPEPAYWFVATTLAKRGFVVLTFDVQGQGRSDVIGAGDDRFEGVPSQAGRPFFDGAEDALDFLHSTPLRPYRPRPACTTGASHADKQLRRVVSGFNTAYNPLWRMIDTERIGIGGQSLGAAAASYVGQADPRVDAIFALDNLAAPDGPAGLAAAVDCPAAPASRAPAPISKPAIGISNDYFIRPQPYADAPDADEKAAASLAFSKAGVDSAQINIRGGTHEECAYVPLQAVVAATLRGIDLCAWYIAAWMDKYVKGDPTADRRILTRRWLSDARDRDIDPAGAGNLMSFHFRSRADVRLSAGGRRVTCEGLRQGECRWLTSDDLWDGVFDRRALALSLDGTRGELAYGPALRQGRRAAIATSTTLTLQRRRGRTRARAEARGSLAEEVERFELQVRRGGRWRDVPARRLGPGRSATIRMAAGVPARARAIDRLGGAGPWSRPVRAR